MEAWNQQRACICVSTCVWVSHRDERSLLCSVLCDLVIEKPVFLPNPTDFWPQPHNLQCNYKPHLQHLAFGFVSWRPTPYHTYTLTHTYTHTHTHKRNILVPSQLQWSIEKLVSLHQRSPLCLSRSLFHSSRSLPAETSNIWPLPSIFHTFFWYGSYNVPCWPVGVTVRVCVCVCVCVFVRVCRSLHRLGYVPIYIS